MAENPDLPISQKSTKRILAELYWATRPLKKEAWKHVREIEKRIKKGGIKCLCD